MLFPFFLPPFLPFFFFFFFLMKRELVKVLNITTNSILRSEITGTINYVVYLKLLIYDEDSYIKYIQSEYEM